MARIRTIKPEFCTSEQVAECSPTARLLFVTMWMFCDDGGNHPAKLMQLKAECFPVDAFDREKMGELVKELLDNELLTEYTGDDGRSYWHVTGWSHQKIDKPKMKYPPYVENSETSRDQSETSRDQSRMVDAVPYRTVPDRKGPEGSGEGRRVDDDTPTRGLCRCPSVHVPDGTPDEVRDAIGTLVDYQFLRDGRVNAIQVQQQVADCVRQLSRHGPEHVVRAIERTIAKGSRHQIYWTERVEQQAKVVTVPEDF